MRTRDNDDEGYESRDRTVGNVVGVVESEDEGYESRGHVLDVCHHNSNNGQQNNMSATDPGPSKTRSMSSRKPMISGRVIQVEGDGRCLFRSLITCLSNELQKTRRDDFGCPLMKNDAHYETLMADALRARVVQLMSDNVQFYGQLEQTIINADQPIPTCYSHFLERLRDMGLTSTMPGDLELNATSCVIEMQLLVVDPNLSPIVLYGKDRFPQKEVVVVRFTRLGSCVGHYDAVIPDPDSLLDIGMDPGLYWHNAGPNKRNKKIEKFDCFGTRLTRMGNEGQESLSIDKSTSKHTNEVDVSNNKEANSNTLSGSSGEGENTENATIQNVKCKKCCLDSAARDVLSDILSEYLLFVPGPMVADSRTQFDELQMPASRRNDSVDTNRKRLGEYLNINYSSNRKQRKENGSNSRRKTSAKLGQCRTSKAGVGQKRRKAVSTATSKTKIAKKPCGRRTSKPRKPNTKVTSVRSFTDLNRNDFHPETVFLPVPKPKNDDVIPDYLSKKCIVCRLPTSFKQKVVKCVICTRVAHKKCALGGQSDDMETYYCTFCTANFMTD